MNDFQILNKLGDGAYSVVYKVRRLVDGNIYALKKVKLLNLSEKEKLNSLNEVRILASIKCPCIITYKEAFFDEEESCLGIVMEYADKGDLYNKIKEFKKSKIFFEESDIWRIFIQMVQGLKALHDMKILHRDLKSANIFLMKDGSAKLGDLNVSKVVKRGLGYTQTGTPYYASPEVWKDKPYDSKSDIWSLGCVLYEMVSLRPPFRAENMEGLYNKVVKGQFSKIPERFSKDLETMLRLLINVNPEQRPSCDEIMKNNIFVKRVEFFKSWVGDDTVNNDLLQTIRIPQNLLSLTERLPEPNYGKKPCINSVNYQSQSNIHSMQNDAPKIAKIMKKVKEKEKFKPENGDGTEIPKTRPTEKLIKEEANAENEQNTKKEREKGKSPEIIRKNQLLDKDSNAMLYLPQLEKKQILNSRDILPKKNKSNANEIKGRHDHLSEIYEIYGSYMRGSNNAKPAVNKNKRMNNKANYLKQLERQYDISNHYRQKLMNPNYKSPKVIVNHKLSPLKKNIAIFNV